MGDRPRSPMDIDQNDNEENIHEEGFIHDYNDAGHPGYNLGDLLHVSS